ncbi:response regulator [Actinoplanes sp. NPDC051475]|uniref:response regulator n=1 Tax=Actinoplanes sp. NPDC051475 TaxID=3157225 RepID=UPI003450204E
MAVVVLAEDDDDIRALIERVLRRAGHQVRAAADGAQAWQLVTEQRSEQGPDIVVSDIDMPVMSGVRLCLLIRADPALQHLPVVFVSGSLLPGDQRPVQAQATAMLRKPFTPQELLACVDKALQTGHDQGQQPSTCP